MIKYFQDMIKRFSKKDTSGKVKYIIKLSIFLLFYIFVMVVSFVKVDYVSKTPGSVTLVSDVIEVDTTYQKGNIYTVSIYSSSEISIMEYWLHRFNGDAEVEKKYSEDEDSITFRDIMTDNELNTSDTAMKLQSIQDSIILAYETAKAKGHDVSLIYEKSGYRLYYVFQNYWKTGPGDFKVGDIIQEVNGQKVTNLAELKAKFATSITNVTCKVIRDGKSISLTLSTTMRNNFEKLLIDREFEYNGSTYKMNTEIGATYYTIDYENSTPKCTVNEVNTSGPSGGLMQTLAVYNAITRSDITNGKRLMGTGTVDIEGTVGAIGGIEQKIVTAEIWAADIFIVPDVNYDDALKKYQEKKYNYTLVSVSSFEELITYLEGEMAQ